MINIIDKIKDAMTPNNTSQQQVQPPVSAPVGGPRQQDYPIKMKEDKFAFMVTGEPEDQVQYIRREMSRLDAIGNYPYKIQTRRAIYEIRRGINSYGQDVTDEYGTGYTISTIGK